MRRDAHLQLVEHGGDDGVLSIECGGCPGEAAGACEDCIVTVLVGPRKHRVGEGDART